MTDKIKKEIEELAKRYFWERAGYRYEGFVNELQNILKQISTDSNQSP